MNRSIKSKTKKFEKRKKSVRNKIRGTANRPRVAIQRSHNHIYAQIIDDESMSTLVSASDFSLEEKKGKPVEIAEKVGEELARKAKDKKIDAVVFDRSGYKYHGRVKALADGMRKAGLSF